VATYITYLVFTLGFIGLVTRSVWLELYGPGPVGHVEGSRPTVAACADDVESLNRELETRLTTPLAPRSAKSAEHYQTEWYEFTRTFEDRMRRVQARCIDQPPQGDTGSVREAMEACMDRLDTLRQHLSRCGLEGVHDRKSVADAIAELRVAAQHPGP
jgi:hypothetical protein